MERSSILARPSMENLEEIFGEDSGDDRSLEVYDEMVTALAGSIYSELEKLISTYGQGAVTGLMPLLVSVLESTEAACTQAREREEQLELVEEEKRQLVTQFERERQFRKRVEERCMEMEDGIEQERKGYKANLTAMEAQTKNMEVKARNYADHIAILDEQKASLGKELASLAQSHAKMVASYKELKYQRSVSLEAARQSGNITPLYNSEKKMLAPTFQECPASPESISARGFPGSSSTDKGALEEEKAVPSKEISKSCSTKSEEKLVPNGQTLEDEIQRQLNVADKDEGMAVQVRTSEVDDIINSTPELQLQSSTLTFSTPKKQRDEKDEEIEEEEETDRNTDSLFAEVCGASPEYIGDMDEGADLQGVGNTLEALMSENLLLKDTQTAVDVARKNLIARVEELTGEREGLKREVESLQQNLTRHEAKIRETEQELLRMIEELEEVKKLNREETEADVPAAQRKRFTRAEMARVLMERNQYKERLMELQDAVRRTEMLRVSTKDVQTAQMKKSSFWKIFSRLFNSNETAEKNESNPPAMRMVRSASSITYADSRGNGGRSSPSLTFHPRTSPHADGDDKAVSLRQQKREHYRQIRAHIWKEHGRVQLHGWSQPPALACKGDGRDTEGEVQGAPMLVQLRLLDQKDPSTKLWCATGVCDTGPRRDSKEANQLSDSLMWICSGTHSVSEVMVIDASRSNHVLDQFVIPNAHVLCISSVPGSGQDAADSIDMENAPPVDQKMEDKTHERGKGSLATVWLGTQEGCLYVHSAVSDWRECVQRVQLKDAVHCIVHSRDRVVAALGDGTLAIFHRDADRQWDLENPRVVDLGRPQQSVRCAAAVHNKVWCGYRNRIYIVEPRMSKIEKWFEATSRPESQVRFMVSAREGVWVSVRLDATLRLFHAHTSQPLQELELEPFVHRMLGSNNLGFSFVQISALATFCDRLWIGTSNGIVVSIPFSEQTGHLNITAGTMEQALQTASTSASLPYCSVEYAQVCFHGHRDAVKFFASVPGCINPALAEASREECNGRTLTTTLAMSGGEGYINFRIGDDTGDSEEGFGDLLLVDPRQRRSERSHLIVWQVHS